MWVSFLNLERGPGVQLLNFKEAGVVWDPTFKP